MSRLITAELLTEAAFAPFGDVLAATGDPDRIINRGLCGRWHDRALLDFGPEGRAGVSVFRAVARHLPLTLDMVECHPDGSQAFLPMTDAPFLVVVAPDAAGLPGTPRAFLTTGREGVNYHAGTWHGVLTPLHDPGLFAVIDRIGPGANLREHWFDTPWQIAAPP